MAKSSKGSRFERDICKQLSLWWTEGQRDDVFWRTSGSGARATVRMKQNECTAFSAGDLGCIDPIGIPFLERNLIEIKRGYTNIYKPVKNKKTGKWGVKKSNPGIDLLSCLDSTKAKHNLLLDWWDKAEQERKQHDRHSTFIIFKRDRKEACIMMTFKTMFWIHGLSYEEDSLSLSIGGRRVLITKLSDFLNKTPPIHFKRTRKLKRRRKIKHPG